MAKANLLNTGTTTLLELIGNGRLYTVPAYQRDYSWTEEQWEDLWTDIEDLSGRPEHTRDPQHEYWIDRHDVGNVELEAKLDAYRQSRYASSNTLPDKICNEWTPAKLEMRQAQLARRAVHLRRADFA